MKKISIIVPVYNVTDYLDKCISSIYSQLTNDIEVILVDDGSTDGVSSELCDVWARRDTRISVVHKKNGGLSDARNAGLKQATGKYIFFVDGDDYIEENTMQVLLPYTEHNDELIVFNFRTVDGDGNELSCSHFLPGFTDISNIDTKIEFIAGQLTKYRIGWEAWNRLFRKDIIDKYNLAFYDNKTIFAEDLYFSLCYIAHVDSLRVIPNILYNYLKRSNSIMGKEAGLNNLARFSLLSEQVYNHYSCSSDCDKLVECFPLINGQILYIEIPRIMKVEQYSLKGLCNEFRNTLPNKTFQHRMCRSFSKYARYIRKYLSDWELQDEISTIKYLQNGNYFDLRVRNRLFYEKKKLDSIREENAKRKEFNLFAQNPRKIYLIGTEDYGNLGDHKISEAINHFLKDNCPGYAVKEITGSKYNNEKKYLEDVVQEGDVLALTGGGNLGDIYPAAERIRYDVINTWKANKKIIFPQTIFFKNSKAFERSKEIYTKDNNVILFARETVSYELANNNYSCIVEKVPDIVLYENEETDQERTDTILLCLRSDIEKSISLSDEEAIMKMAHRHAGNVKVIDTQLDHNVTKEDRASEIEKVIRLFRESKLVITDRLHGMIFATITGTPCIALNNYNHKISGSYDWIKNNSFIQLASSLDDALEMIEIMAQLGQRFHYSSEVLYPYFNLIAKVIKE